MDLVPVKKKKNNTIIVNYNDVYQNYNKLPNLQQDNTMNTTDTNNNNDKENI